MPYIDKKSRAQLDSGTAPAETPGELNYLLTCLVDDYVNRMGLKYATINDAMGALEGAKLEFYRRVAAPYEDGKITTNGEVYTCLPKSPIT